MEYRLAFPLALVGIHNVFHVFQLRKYVGMGRLIPDVSEVKLGLDLSSTQSQ